MEPLEKMTDTDTIAAISTAQGTGGIAVIRVSGPLAIDIVDSAWKGKRIAGMESHTTSLGCYISTDGTILDEAVATLFRCPRSFTGEDVVELSVHGSRWIQREVLSDLIRRGARTAGPGEFTQRAFLNGKLDLAQAEGVADLIASSSRGAHQLALTQTRGKFSKELNMLRDKLVEFASLLELELDFSEEDVEFADRSRLLELAATILKKVERLADSYSSGSAIKDGLPVVIAGVPNAGKSSLLNLLLDDDKAIVTDIPGTTRDIIEDTIEIDGILYRFIDTAGLRSSNDAVESIGIDRARAKMKEANIIIWILDPTSPLSPQINELDAFKISKPDARIITLLNKSDLKPLTKNPSEPLHHDDSSIPPSVIASNVNDSTVNDSAVDNSTVDDSTVNDSTVNDSTVNDSIANDSAEKASKSIVFNFNSIENQTSAIPFSTLSGEGLSELKNKLKEFATGDFNPLEELIVTNARHYEALTKGASSLRRAIDGIRSGLSSDFIAQDVREATTNLGAITGSIATTDLLHSIFSHFCIGK